MKRTIRTRRWLVTALLVLSVSAGPTATSIGAATDPVGRPAPAASVAATDERHAVLLSRPAPAESLAAQAGEISNPTPSDIGLSRPAPASLAAPVALRGEEGFDWPAAGIGIAAGIAVTSLAGVIVVMSRRRIPEGPRFGRRVGTTNTAP